MARTEPAPGAILVAVSGSEPAAWEAELRAQAPRRELQVWPDRIGAPAQVAYACVWKPPGGLLRQFANLQVIFSLGAGVDHLLSDSALPAVPLVRIVDPDLTGRMTEYVVLQVLMHH